MAKHTVYNGEYSLKRWIDLILTSNVVLPEYQRYYVWDKKQASTLMKSISKGYFLPAVTIAHFTDPTTHQLANIILDGQQRLTSLLLAYIGKFPKIKRPTKKFPNENDKEEDGDGSTLSEWTFKKLVSVGSTKGEIVHDIDANHAAEYENFAVDGLAIDDLFLETHYIQFAFIVPDSTATPDDINTYLTNVFYSINREGTKLTPIESRSALYYQGGDNKSRLEPDFSKNIKVNGTPMDFVRFLALMSNYKKVGKMETAKGLANVSKRESLYEDFVRDFVTNELPQSDKFVEIPDFDARLTQLSTVLTTLNLAAKSYTTIIDLDLYYSGVVYHVMIDGKTLDMTNHAAVQASLTTKKAEYNDSDEHKKAPGALQYLRDRLEQSINLYQPLFV